MICVYCGRTVAKSLATKDHVFARSWLPKGASANQRLWTVRACRNCNGKLGKAEQELLTHLGMCVDPDHPASREIAENTIHTLDPRRGKNPRDAAARFRGRQRILESEIKTSTIDKANLLPSFRENLNRGSDVALKVSASLLHEVIVKWTKGMHYVIFRRILQPDDEVLPFTIGDEDAVAMLQGFSNQGLTLDLGPALSVTAWHAEQEREQITIYEFSIWQQFKAWSSAHEKHLCNAAETQSR